MKFREHLEITVKSIKLLISLSKAFSVCVLLGSVITALLPYVPIYFSARLIDALFEGQSMPKIAGYVCLTVGMVFILSLIKTYLSSRESAALNELNRNEWWRFSEKAMEMAYESIENRDVAMKRERIRMESQTGYNIFYLVRSTNRFIGYGTQVIASLSLTLSFFRIDAISPTRKLLFGLGVVMTILIGIYTTKKVEEIQYRLFESDVDINTLLMKYGDYTTQYSSGKDIRVYNMRDSLSRFQYERLKIFAERGIKASLKKSAIRLADQAVSSLFRLGTYMVLIYAALLGAITVGSIAQYVSCMMLMLTAVSGIVTSLQLMLDNHRYLKNYFSYFEIPNNMYQGSLTVEKRDDNEYYVEFRDVSFRYPGMETYALRHLNLKFKVGEKLAVVGMNGSGKTTFIKLLCRLYDPTEGEILLNGVNIKKYDYEEYMSIFSVVFQDFRLFSFTLGENVAASADFDCERADMCLRKAGFGERLDQMSEDLRTYLYKDYSKDGVEISGGEAQKIALARALYKDAPFIVLDEPTAALDPISEYEIYSRFNRIAGDKTAIYISHRLASCRFCDKIAVFHEGAVIQQGAHRELLADEGGKYYELWNAQAQYYVSG